MDLQLIPVHQFQIFLICTARVAGFIGAIPVYFGNQTPARIKVTLVFTISLLLFPILSPGLPTISFEPISFLLLTVNETLLGLLIGLMSRLVFTTVEFGGTIIGYQMGFAAANVFDPQHQNQVSLISQFQNVFAILIFLALDGHHIFIKTAARSYQLLPPGNLNLSGEAIPYLMELTSRMFTLAVQFSAPVLVVLLLSGLILGILARVFPQLNVFLLSFPLNIGIAFIVIALTLDMVTSLLRREFDAIGERILTLLQYL
ncbi:MAG: flagellar biosynthetic protein FliR [Proteobacteria bacterium]|nr:flagellar biosynthetic protein FliR [Desulfocapsa sp.]MBU3943818.1 flagellar biosynthetic protein FliR [Pseudomonadota bacterium]MCG2743687.1 flagellar biosynthetic protein FliR [Desulfobacteraceae bacterium]MBU3983228.1 flagellar biosynthetic protein FliR [Pseudomonadota bacterium]MBU4082985.1 flagellar biosynthetic protein FliR [Pseudomonadota bacterium]